MLTCKVGACGLLDAKTKSGRFDALSAGDGEGEARKARLITSGRVSVVVRGNIDALERGLGSLLGDEDFIRLLARIDLVVHERGVDDFTVGTDLVVQFHRLAVGVHTHLGHTNGQKTDLHLARTIGIRGLATVVAKVDEPCTFVFVRSDILVQEVLNGHTRGVLNEVLLRGISGLGDTGSIGTGCRVVTRITHNASMAVLIGGPTYVGIVMQPIIPTPESGLKTDCFPWCELDIVVLLWLLQGTQPCKVCYCTSHT